MAQTQAKRFGDSSEAPHYEQLGSISANGVITVRNVDTSELATLLAEDGERLFAVIGFGAAPALKLPCAFTTVAMPVWASNETASQPFEAWLAPTAVRRWAAGDLKLARTDEMVFGCIALEQTPDQALEDITETAYSEIFAAIDQLGMPHLSRVWHYLPAINENEVHLEATAAERSLERYRRFSLGRHEAFVKYGRVIERDAPAASALGTQRMIEQGLPDQLVIYFIATAQQGEPIENPRQVSAYRYPQTYGPRSPTFARALIAPINRDVYYVSGTASIVGHATLHTGDVRKQTEETLLNLQALFEERAQRVAASDSDWHVKVYVRHLSDFDDVRTCVEPAMQQAWAQNARKTGLLEIVYLQADICRSDLLVEIELLCKPALQAASNRR
jgi:chorismate lyase / 3-hydroxybenzoate synthase